MQIVVNGSVVTVAEDPISWERHKNALKSLLALMRQLDQQDTMEGQGAVEPEPESELESIE